MVLRIFVNSTPDQKGSYLQGTNTDCKSCEYAHEQCVVDFPDCLNVLYISICKFLDIILFIIAWYDFRIQVFVFYREAASILCAVCRGGQSRHTEHKCFSSLGLTL